MNLILAQAKGQSDQQVAFYRDHLKNLVSAWRNHMNRFDQAVLIQNAVKTLMEGDNTKEDLAYQVMVAVDMMARSGKEIR
jgi:sulfur transfer complex TusBCD TusB component (DsrH family)